MVEKKENRNKNINVRCTATEIKMLKENSFLEGKSISAYVLDSCMANIERPKNTYKKAIRYIVGLTEILNQLMKDTDDNCKEYIIDKYKQLEEEKHASVRSYGKK